MALCLKEINDAICLKQTRHTGACNQSPSVWTEISHDPGEKTRKKSLRLALLRLEAATKVAIRTTFQEVVESSSLLSIPTVLTLPTMNRVQLYV